MKYSNVLAAIHKVGQKFTQLRLTELRSRRALGIFALIAITFVAGWTSDTALAAASTIAATSTIDSAPSVTSNPTNVSLNAGDTAIFTAAADGAPAPTVQWMVSTDGGASFNAVSGATSTTLSFTTSAGQNTYKYEAVFTNTAGGATTMAASLNVSSAPAITLNPVNVSVGTTGTATFTAAANGYPAPTVQWLVSTDGGGTFGTVSGATSTTLSFTAATSQSGNLYEAVFTNSLTSSTSTTALLTVTATSMLAVAITNPSTQSITLATGGMINFAASISNGAAGTGVNWSVSGIAGGDSTVGTITGSTLSGELATYTAPTSAPGGGSVAIVATYAGAGSAASSPTTVNIVANQNAALSGQVAFQVRGFQLSGLPFGMVGTFTADGNGGMTNVLIDSNYVQSTQGGSLVTSKQPWTASYAMDTVNHGILHLALASNPTTQMNFSIALNGTNGSMVEIDALLGSSASGAFSAASSSAFTTAAGGLNGNYILRIEGPTSGVGNGYNGIIGQLTFAQTGSSTTAGTVMASALDSNAGDSFSSMSSGTVTLDADGSGHGTFLLPLDGGSGPTMNFYVSNAGNIFVLDADSGGSPLTGVLRAQTIPGGGFTTSSAFPSPMVFEAMGASTSTTHASVIVGGFSQAAPNSPNVVGEYDASDGGTILGGSPVQLTGTFTIDPSIPGRGTLTFMNGSTTVHSFIFYLLSPGQGFLVEFNGTTESLVGKFVTQTPPGGGFVDATLNGITTAAGTHTATQASINGVSVLTFGTGSYASDSDGGTVGQSPFVGATSAGTVSFTDSVRGRGTLTVASGSIFGATSYVFYAIDSTGRAVMISLDPTLLEPQIITIGN